MNEHISFQDLYNNLLSKLGSYINTDNIDIYLYVGRLVECPKKDMPITSDNNVKWIYHIITPNV